LITWWVRGLLAAAVVAGLSGPALGQAVPPTPPGQPTAAAQQGEQAQTAQPEPQMDVFDLVRELRNKPQPDEASWDYRKRMTAFAPVIGYKPTSGFMFGAAGNVASYYGDPATTHISSAVLSATFSQKKQTSISGRYKRFSDGDRWMVEGDNRAQWTSQDSYGLGTSTLPEEQINAKYNFFRLYNTAYYRLHPGLFAGIGLHYNTHTDIRPGNDVEDAAWQNSPYMQYTQLHGFPVDKQTSAGTSVNLLIEGRDNPINPDRGTYLQASYRTFYADFLGGDSTWQQLYVDARRYAKLSDDGRKKLAFWAFGDFVTGGYAPYLDLPATGMDTYGRSGRGYGEGRFRGERLLYGEVEYRASLMRSGLVGMVAFFNLTTVTNLETGERLFHSWAPGGGAGLRLSINKRSKTNLCFDVGFGKEGSRGVYLAVQEAF
jgi:outer membrane protein assembly factor BamA